MLVHIRIFILYVRDMANDTNGLNYSPELWRHSNPKDTQFYAFQQHVKQKHNIAGESYEDLWQWSVDNPAAFWEEIWHYTGIKASTPYKKVK